MLIIVSITDSDRVHGYGSREAETALCRLGEYKVDLTWWPVAYFQVKCTDICRKFDTNLFGHSHFDIIYLFLKTVLEYS